MAKVVSLRPTGYEYVNTPFGAELAKALYQLNVVAARIVAEPVPPGVKMKFPVLVPTRQRFIITLEQVVYDRTVVFRLVDAVLNEVVKETNTAKEMLDIVMALTALEGGY